MRAPETVAIAITCADDSIALMQFVTNDFRGLTQVPDFPTVDREVRRASASFDADKLPVKGWTPVDPRAIPADRTFRNALRHDGTQFSHCPVHAKELALQMVRVHREPRFMALDAQRAAAVRGGHKERIEEIDREAQALADLTEPVKACQTVPELKAALAKIGV